MATYQCTTCDLVETLRFMVPDCCSACGSSVVSDTPQPDIADLEAMAYEAAERAYADEVEQDATIVDALGMWSSWHADVPPTNATANRHTDLQLADAFRMLIYLGEPVRQLEFIERELKPRMVEASFNTVTAYQAALMRWWLQIFEHQYSQRQTVEALN